MDTQAFLTKVYFSLATSLIVAVLYGGSALLAAYRTRPSSPPAAAANVYVSDPRFAYLLPELSRLTASPAPISPILGSHTEAARSVPVIYYHGIAQIASDEEVSWASFKNQMYTLKENGYETISLEQLEGYLLRGETLPDRSFLLTFDDGRKDSYYPADPVLAALNYRAVMFVITSVIDNPGQYHLSRAELIRAQASGRWQIQSHSHAGHTFITTDADGATGPFLTRPAWLAGQNRPETAAEYQDRVTRDLTTAQKILEDEFTVTAFAFAFPFGEHSPDLDRAVQSLYRLAFYQAWGNPIQTNYPGTDTFLVKRIGVDPSWSAVDLLRVLENSRDKTLPFSDDLSLDRGWISRWGQVRHAPGSLVLDSLDHTAGAGAYLDGTSLWSDVNFQATVTLEMGNSFTLMARIDPAGDYLGCAFTPGSVSYVERRDGVVSRLQTRTFASPLLYPQVRAALQVSGNLASCLVDDRLLVDQAPITHPSDHGMIGVNVWGTPPAPSRLVVKNISASAQ